MNKWRSFTLRTRQELHSTSVSDSCGRGNKM